MSRIISATVVACSLLQAVVAAQSATDRAAVQKSIVAHEKAIMDAILKNDPKTFHSYVLPDSLSMGGEGVTKAADFDAMMAQMTKDCKFSKWGVEQSTFSWINDSTVVHLYKATVAGTCQGQPVPATWASTVWTNKNGKWLGAFHHESPVQAPPAAKK